MDEFAKALIQYGALGIVVAVLLAVIAKLGKVAGDRLNIFFDQMGAFMNETTKALQTISAGMANHDQQLTEIRRELTGVTKVSIAAESFHRSLSPTPPQHHPPKLPPPKDPRRG